jgi:hypothetical protein
MTGNEEPDVAGFDAQADELRQRLTSNSFFNALPEKLRKKLLKGRDAHLYPLEDLAERADVGRDIFRFLHILFSQHVHGLPLSFIEWGVTTRIAAEACPARSRRGTRRCACRSRRRYSPAHATSCTSFSLGCIRSRRPPGLPNEAPRRPSTPPPSGDRRSLAGQVHPVLCPQAGGRVRNCLGERGASSRYSNVDIRSVHHALMGREDFNKNRTHGKDETLLSGGLHRWTDGRLQRRSCLRFVIVG